jgi:hypothetical protein
MLAEGAGDGLADRMSDRDVDAGCTAHLLNEREQARRVDLEVAVDLGDRSDRPGGGGDLARTVAGMPFLLMRSPVSPA